MRTLVGIFTLLIDVPKKTALPVAHTAGSAFPIVMSRSVACGTAAFGHKPCRWFGLFGMARNRTDPAQRVQ